MTQTKLESWIEQICNVGSGFILSFIYWQLLVVPQVENQELTVTLNLWITIQFTVISVLRGYLWRRYFNARLTRRIRQIVTTN